MALHRDRLLPRQHHVPAPRAAAAIRDHSKIENTPHDSRDVTMAENRSRICFNPGIFARLRSSPSASSKPTAKAHSLRTAFAPLSAGSITSSAAFAFQSVEQPCLEAYYENVI